MLRKFINYRLFFVFGFVFILFSCNTMSVRKAQNIAVNFHGEYKSVPQRKFEAYIEVIGNKYPEADSELLDRCSVPNKRLSDSELIRSYTTGGKAWMLCDRAEREYFLGNLDLALRYVNYAQNLSSDYYICRASASKAIYLAELGEIRAAELALIKAVSALNSFDHGSSKDVYMSRYQVNRAKAAIALAKGNIQKAEKLYVKAIRNLENTNFSYPWYAIPAVKIRLARSIMQQGRLVEAEILTNEALRYYCEPITPFGLITLSEIYLEQNRCKDALYVAQIALNACLRMCVPSDSYIRAYSRETIAKAQIAQRLWDAALYQFEMIKVEMKTDVKIYRKRFRGSVDWGLALLMSGRAESSIFQFNTAYEKAKTSYNGDHYNVYEAHALMAIALGQTGSEATALDIFDNTISKLVNHWGDKSGVSVMHQDRINKFELIVESYISLLVETGNLKKAIESFSLASMVQNQSVSNVISSSFARSSVGNPQLKELIRQKQDLELKLASYQNRLITVINAVQEKQDIEILDKLHGEMSYFRKAVETLDKEVQIKFPNYSAIVSPGEISVEKIRNQLTNQEAFLTCLVGENITFIWAFQKSGPVAFAKVQIGKKELTDRVDALRQYLEPRNVFSLGEFTNFNVELGYDLYRKLLQPVEKGWKSAKRIMFVPHGSMGQLPLSVLPTAPCKIRTDKDVLFTNHRNIPWLARTHAVSILPSVASLGTIRSLPTGERKQKAFVGFGDPIFNSEQLTPVEGSSQGVSQIITSRGISFKYRGIRLTNEGELDGERVKSCDISKLSPLPDTRDEIESIAATLQADVKKDVFLGRRAAEKIVKSMQLSDRRVIMFATHALVPGDIDGLHQPAIALSAPSVTGDNDDGLLTMGEVMDLNLDAEWVV
ncbi:MAG: CHAT domain-containing protein, partial [Deltaproteobacteria bacterium]|nr:CHAT domain-containing protein [Deltaproteobacteria bacterium]